MNFRHCIYGFFFVILSNAVLSASQVIQVVENPKEQSVSGLTAFLKSWWIWLIATLIIVALILWLLVYIIKKLKEGKDIWYKITKDKKYLCKMHRDKQRIKKYFRMSKNSPLRLFYKENDEVRTKTIGYYRGHYTSRDGNITIMFNCRRKWLIFPKNDFLFINSKEKIIIVRKEINDTGIKKEVKNIEEVYDLPKNIVSFNQDEILINAYSIDMDYRTEFFVPVLKDRQGNVINMALPTYESMKQIAIEGYLYDQTDDYSKVLKKSIDLNPTIKAHNKISDSSSSIESQQPRVQ